MFLWESVADRGDKGLAEAIHITGPSARVQGVLPRGLGCARRSARLDDKGRTKKLKVKVNAVLLRKRLGFGAACVT